MELERFVRLEWPRLENESQFFINPILTIDSSTSTLCSTPFHCAVHAPFQATARCYTCACTSDVFEFKLRLRKGAQNTHMVAER